MPKETHDYTLVPAWDMASWIGLNSIVELYLNKWDPYDDNKLKLNTISITQGLKNSIRGHYICSV